MKKHILWIILVTIIISCGKKEQQEQDVDFYKAIKIASFEAEKAGYSFENSVVQIGKYSWNSYLKYHCIGWSDNKSEQCTEKYKKKEATLKALLNGDFFWLANIDSSPCPNCSLDGGNIEIIIDAKTGTVLFSPRKTIEPDLIEDF